MTNEQLIDFAMKLDIKAGRINKWQQRVSGKT